MLCRAPAGRGGRRRRQSSLLQVHTRDVMPTVSACQEAMGNQRVLHAGRPCPKRTVAVGAQGRHRIRPAHPPNMQRLRINLQLEVGIFTQPGSSRIQVKFPNGDILMWIPEDRRWFQPNRDKQYSSRALRSLDRRERVELEQGLMLYDLRRTLAIRRWNTGS